MMSFASEVLFPTRSRPLTGLALLALLAAAPGHAQTQPSAASILRQQEAAMPQRVPQAAPAPAIESPERKAVPVVPGGPAVRIVGIRVTGGEGLAEQAALDALVQPALGQSLGSSQLLALADQVNSHLKSRGWLLAQAYLPPQDVTEGRVEIRISAVAIEGGLEGIVIAGKPQRVGEARIRRMVAAAMPDAAQGRLNAQQLEAGLLRAGELAGVSATAALERGAQPGTSRLTVEAKEAPATSASVTADNFGSPYTGVHRLTGLFLANSPLGLGDSLMVSAATSTGTKLLTSSLAVPVGYSGLKLGGSLTALDYRVGGSLADLGLAGKAQMAGLNASYPLRLTQASSLRLRVALDRKAFSDKLEGELIGDKRVTTLQVGLNGQSSDGWLGGGLNDWSVAFQRGRLDLSRIDSVLAADQDGAQAHGVFDKWVFSYARLQPLKPGWTAQFSVNAQVAGKNLDGSEKFLLGGNSGIRAYPGGEAAGDSGWLASTTLRRELAWPTSAWRLELSGFFDWGRIHLNQSPWTVIDNATGRNSYGLAGTGLGATLARTGTGRASLVWAHALGDNTGRSVTGNNSDGKANRNRLLLALTLDL